jgi:hypothetical protein
MNGTMTGCLSLSCRREGQGAGSPTRLALETTRMRLATLLFLCASAPRLAASASKFCQYLFSRAHSTPSFLILSVARVRARWSDSYCEL